MKQTFPIHFVSIICLGIMSIYFSQADNNFKIRASREILNEPLYWNENLFHLLEESAESGDPDAQANIGAIYSVGNKFVKKDMQKALYWLKKAVEKDSPLALYNLGILYQNPESGCQDFTKAVELFSRAIEKGYKDAYRVLGLCYELGQGVEQILLKHSNIIRLLLKMEMLLLLSNLVGCMRWDREFIKILKKQSNYILWRGNAGILQQ